MKALVVDDELTSRIVLQETLSGFGQVHTCVDGAEAVEACRRALDRGDPYDLICLDLLMPSMNGLEALKLIRDDEQRHGRMRPEQAKVIITTAADDKESISSAFGKFCDAYIVKPVDPGELLGLVHCLCSTDDCGDPVAQ